MKFKRLVSVLCSVTCGIGGVGAKQNASMEGRFREILKARVVGGLVGEKVVDDVMQILESLDKDPEVRKKVLELASSYEVKSWVRYLFSVFSVAGSRVAQAISILGFLVGVGAGAIRSLPDNLGGGTADMVWNSNKNEIRTVAGYAFIAAAIVCVVFGAADLGLSLGASALNRSSAECQGIRGALEKLVKESEGMQNQADVSGNKLKEKKSGSSASNGGSQKSGNGGSGKIKKRGRSKVKGKGVGNSARNEVLN